MSKIFAFLSIVSILLYPSLGANTNLLAASNDCNQSTISSGQPVLQTSNVRYVKSADRFLIANEDDPRDKNEITVDYDNSTGLSKEELDYLRDFIDGGNKYKVGIKTCIEMVFGKPFFPLTIKLIKRDASTSSYDATSQVITLQPRICVPDDLFPKLETLAHELIHAYSDVLMKPVNCYEEGLAVAQTDLACKLFCEINGVTGRCAEVFDGPPAGTRNYELLNQEAAAAADGFFWNSSTTTRVVDPSIRYLLAGTVWWKIWRETVPGNITWTDERTYGKGTFFVDFNNLFCNTFKKYLDAGTTIVFDKDRQTQFKANIREVLRNDKGNATVEGIDFDEWWSKQYIMQTGIDEGPKLFVSQSYQSNGLPTLEPGQKWQCSAFPQINYFYKDEKGSEIVLNGRLLVTLTSLSSPRVEDPACLARNIFYNNGDKPPIWSEFEINGGQVVSLVKTQKMSGMIDFSKLPRGGYRIDFLATAYDGTMPAKRTLYFANKLDLGDAMGLCFGTIEADRLGRLYCERSSMPDSRIEIPINGDGTYIASFAPVDVIRFTYETTDWDGLPKVYEASVSAGSWLVVKNLVFKVN